MGCIRQLLAVSSKSVVDSWWIEDGSLLPSQQSHPFPESCFNQSDQATAHIANKRRYAFFQDRYTNQGVFIPRVCSKRISGFDLFSSGMNSLCQVAFPFIGLFGTDRRMREISNLDLKGVQFKKTGLQAARERLDGPKQQSIDGRDHPEAHSTIGRYGEWRLKGLLDERQKALLMIRRTE